MNLKRIILVICLVLIGLSVYAQSVSVNAYLDTNTIWVGDQVHFTIEVTKDQQIDVQLPVFSNTLGDEIEIIEQYETDTSIKNGKHFIKQQMLVTAFDSGMYFVPRLPVIVLHDNRTDTIETSPTFLDVLPFYIQDLKGEAADIKDIKKVPVTFRELLPYLLVYLLLGIIIPGIYYWLKYHKKKPALQLVKPREPAYIIAERELDELKKEKLWQKKEVKEFYVRLTTILRKYIENQFEIKALEQTTSQILQSVNNYGLFDSETRQILADMLPLADMVKFARGTADPDENNKHLENAYKFVQMTKVFIPEQDDEDDQNTKQA
jgi:hypothetical protein